MAIIQLEPLSLDDSYNTKNTAGSLYEDINQEITFLKINLFSGVISVEGDRLIIRAGFRWEQNGNLYVLSEDYTISFPLGRNVYLYAKADSSGFYISDEAPTYIFSISSWYLQNDRCFGITQGLYTGAGANIFEIFTLSNLVNIATANIQINTPGRVSFGVGNNPTYSLPWAGHYLVYQIFAESNTNATDMTQRPYIGDGGRPGGNVVGNSPSTATGGTGGNGGTGETGSSAPQRLYPFYLRAFFPGTYIINRNIRPIAKTPYVLNSPPTSGFSGSLGSPGTSLSSANYIDNLANGKGGNGGIGGTGGSGGSINFGRGFFVYTASNGRTGGKGGGGGGAGGTQIFPVNQDSWIFTYGGENLTSSSGFGIFGTNQIRQSGFSGVGGAGLLTYYHANTVVGWHVIFAPLYYF